MKKVGLILFVFGLLFWGINRQLEYKSDQNIRNYQAQNEYEKKYPINDYVSNKNEASYLIQRTIISGMIDSEDFINEKSNKERLKLAWSYIFNRNFRVNEFVQNLQYNEKKLLKFDKLPIEEQNEYHNYQYIGYDKNGEKVQGFASLYRVKDNYSIAISFLNSDLSVNQKKAELLADDSNAEKLAYDIIRETQELYHTDLPPEEASQKFYNSTIEQIAGAISYHAVVTLAIEEFGVESESLIRAATTDISLIDSDAFFVNRSY